MHSDEYERVFNNKMSVVLLSFWTVSLFLNIHQCCMSVRAAHPLESESGFG